MKGCGKCRNEGDGGMCTKNGRGKCRNEGDSGMSTIKG